MEKGLKELRDYFGLHEAEPESLSPLTLAYIGDAVFELIVRYIEIERAKIPVSRLHKASSRIVCAESQSEMTAVIEPLLEEKELHIYRRGRNAKSNTTAKNASVTDYRRATGFEALFGYLFLKGEHERLLELAEKAIAAKL